MMLNDSNNMPYAILINIISMLKCFKFNSNCVLFDFNKGKKRYKQNDEVHRVFKIIHIKIWILRHKFCLRKCWAITYLFVWMRFFLRFAISCRTFSSYSQFATSTSSLFCHWNVIELIEKEPYILFRDIKCWTFWWNKNLIELKKEKLCEKFTLHHPNHIKFGNVASEIVWIIEKIAWKI